MCLTSLNDLLEKPFRCYPRDEQLRIAKRGRFTDLADLSQHDKGKNRMFAVSWYQRVKWLSGNTVNRKLYCWNCVLFPSGPSRLWNTIGFDDLRNLSQATKKHEESKEHIYSTVKLRILCKSERQTGGEREELENNVKVRRNREYLERLIDISLALALRDIPFRYEDSEDGAYKTLLNLLRKYDDVVRTKVEQDAQFKGFTKTIQIDLVQSIAHVVRQRIVDEVAVANFFSLMVDDAPGNPKSKQVSVAVRYVKNGRPIERFLGLYEVSYGTRSNEVMAVLERDLERLNFKEKLVSQSYDGAVVRPTELYSLQQAVKRQQNDYCQAQLVHYYAHEFSKLLAQSLQTLQECKLFFSVVTLFCRFFEKVNIGDILRQAPSTWLDSTSKCVKHLKTNYDTVLKVLEFVTTSENFENSVDILYEAVNLTNHMKSFKFVALLTIFEVHFSLVDECFEAIKERFPDTKVYRKEINGLIEKLKKLKTDVEFNKIMNSVPISGTPAMLLDMFTWHVQILDNLIHDIEGRSLDIELIDFFGLVSLESLTAQRSKKNPDNALMASIKESYPKFFDTVKLRTELDLLHSDPSIGGIGEHDVTTPGDVMKFFCDYDIKRLLPELYKLLELVSAMPTIGEPLQGDACALNRIRAYCRKERKEEPRSALAMLSIERDLLTEMQGTSQWYSQVIDYFATLPSTSSIELTYKNTEPVVETAKMEVITEPELTIKTEPDM
ncbi:hypothetical protein NQ318_022333 [Aromia moschata]|uniref:DUF4371 domain-containing protein n=1 Tax=Aromia moschata TaxID=1265417 RepID=A0AAV8Z756_9CUCU|nr:hypothetical protein NQ318_022333 [Aromia moschata]